MSSRPVLGTHRASSPVGTIPTPLGTKRQEPTAYHLPPSNAEVKYSGAVPPLLHTPSCCAA
jgi:hypothetical protein